MRGEALVAALSDRPAVGLDELIARAELLTRHDRKYLVPSATAARVVTDLAEVAVLDIDGRRSFGYASTYFDTPELDAYLAAARRRPRRYKVRTRSYLDAERSLVELKVRDRQGHTTKTRLERPFAERDRLGEPGRAFAAGCPLIGEHAEHLGPVLTTTYRRATLLLPGNARATIDSDLVARTVDGMTVALEDVVVIETKSAGPPTVLDRALWAAHVRPVAISKYATSLAAIRPDLPSNRWTRALHAPWHVAGPQAIPARIVA